MAFTITIDERGVMGDKRYVYGKYVNDGGSTGGEVTTGLSFVNSFQYQEKGSAVVGNRSVVDESFPLSSGDVTLVTNSNETGNFIAFGG